MPSKRLGRRAVGTTNTVGAAPAITISGKSQLATVLDDGEYRVVIEGGRAVTGASGATSVVISATHDGVPVRVRPLLIASPGGTSQLVEDNRALLAALADLEEDEEVTLPALLARVAGREVDVELRLAVDREGRPVNELVDVFADEEAA